MRGGEGLASIGAAILFAVFLANVILGAARLGGFLSDVGEMLVLFSACILFVIAVLGQERRVRGSGPKISKQGGES